MPQRSIETIIRCLPRAKQLKVSHHMEIVHQRIGRSVARAGFDR